MKEKEIFYIHDCLSVSRYIKGGRKSHLQSQLNFQRHMYLYATHIDKEVELYFCANIMQLFSTFYFRYTGRLFLGCAFFAARCNLIRNQEGNIELQKKVHSRICVRKITFLIVPPPFYDIFSYFLCLLRSPCQVMYLLNGRYKDA